MAEMGRRYRWEDNIKMGMREVGCGAGDWMDVVQDRNSWQTYTWTIKTSVFLFY